MKNTVITALMGAITIVAASAATSITATNNAGAATRQIQSSLGVPLTNAAGGIYEIGVFTDNTFSVTTTLADFTSAGSTAFSATQPGIFGSFSTPNSISVELPNVGDLAGAFVGKNIFVVIREPGATGNFIAFSTPSLFAFENAALNTGTAVSITNANMTLVKGFTYPLANIGLTGGAAAGNGGTAIGFVAAIPEPSAALLGAIGVLGLLRRRRI